MAKSNKSVGKTLNERQRDSEVFVRSVEKSNDFLGHVFEAIFNNAFRLGYEQALYNVKLKKKKRNLNEK